MVSKIISKNIINLARELKFIILSERSELEMWNKFNSGSTRNTPVLK